MTDQAIDPRLPKLLAEDRALGEAILQRSDASRASWDALLLAAADRNARVDAPIRGKKGEWTATASGVRIDADQGRHPWSVTGSGPDPDAAIFDLFGRLEAMPTNLNPNAYGHWESPS